MKPEPPLKGYEVTVWRGRPFVIGVVAFFLSMGVILLVGGGLTISWTNHTWPPTGPVQAPSNRPDWNSSAPQLQVHASQDLEQLRQQEFQRLHDLKWTDPDHTYASIPIERAMNLMIQAESEHRLNQLLPQPLPATPVELQDQKAGEAPPSSSSP